MFKKFWGEQFQLITASGVVTGLGALFLNISTPVSDEAKVLLANVQAFWLLVISATLSVLFYRFIKYVVQVEQETERKYKVITTGTFSFAVGAILIWVMLSLWGYVMEVYTTSFTTLMTSILPGAVLMGGVGLEIFVKKRSDRFTRFSRIVVDSFSMALSISVAGVYVQQGILKHFYLYWFSLVLPISFLVLFILLSIITKARKQRLFSTTSPKILQ